MAKASWCTVSPTSGVKNGTIAVLASAHTGRLSRSTTIVVQNQSGIKPSANIAVNQAAKGSFLTLMSSANPSMSATGGAFVFATGKSNVAKLDLNFNDGYLNYTNLVLKVNGIAVPGFIEGGFVLPGDPGSTAEYTFEISATFPASTSAYVQTENVSLAGDSLSSAGINLSQAAVASALSLDKSSLSLANAGTAQSVAVTSNDNWGVS